jgi:hypothetical protein
MSIFCRCSSNNCTFICFCASTYASSVTVDSTLCLIPGSTIKQKLNESKVWIRRIKYAQDVGKNVIKYELNEKKKERYLYKTLVLVIIVC